MNAYQCVACRRPIDVISHCPHCGAEQGEWLEELARIERSIAELKARDAALLREQAALAAKLQAALFQRDVLAHAGQEKLKEATRTRRLRWTFRHPPEGETRRIPRQPPFVRGKRPADAAAPPDRPEASSRQVQNVLLGLGALLLAVAAAVFAAVAGDVARLAILTAAAALMLGTPPHIARRGLTATAETVAAVGLLLVLLDGYALWTIDEVRAGPLSGPVFGGLTFVAVAAVAAAYSRVTGLTVPRYATVLALQPVVPLLVFHQITGPAGWALALTAVATLDLYLGLQLTRHGRLDLLLKPPPDAEPTEGSQNSAGLPETTWVLHGLTIAAALIYAVVALLRAASTGAATRAGVVLLVAASIGLAGARTARRPPLSDLAAGVLTISVMLAAGRVAAVTLPGRTLLLVAVVIALTGAGVRALPHSVRRGPQLASAAVLVVIGAVVAVDTVGAAVSTVRAALPPWHADLGGYPDTLATAGGATGDWQLAAAAFLLTVTAVLSVPHELRREFSVVTAAMTALAVPTSLNLPWWAAPWPAVMTAIGIGAAGLSTRTVRAAHTHTVTAALVGFTGAAASLARPGLTAAVLATLVVAGALVTVAATTGPTRAEPAAEVVAAWAAGGAALALPGAATAAIAHAMPSRPTLTPAALEAVTSPVLVAGFLAACTTLGYAALTQVSQRQISLPLRLGTGVGALAVACAAFFAPGAASADAWLGTLLTVATLLLFLSSTIDVRRRSDRLLDGADYTAAGATLMVTATLARVADVLAPDAALATTAGLMLLVAVGIRMAPAEWRRGPILGFTVGGGLVALAASLTAIRAGAAALTTPGGLWQGDLDAWPTTGDLDAWQVPVALVLLAAAAAIALPRPWSYDAAAVLVGLATVGTPAALGLPWWSPILVGLTVAAAYALTSVIAADPRAALTRATVAVAIGLHAIGTSTVRPWATAAALGSVAVVGVLVAVLARISATLPGDSADEPAVDAVDPVPPHLALIGGVATTVALLSLPGAVAALAAELDQPAGTVLTAALAASSLGLPVLAVMRRQMPHYLPYATVGIVGGATTVAVAALFLDLATGVYAAAAVLLGVLAELFRAATRPPRPTEPVRRWSVRLGRSLSVPSRASYHGWSVSPVSGAIAAAVLPTTLAMAALAPALATTLVLPYRTLRQVWQGPPVVLAEPPAEAAATTNVTIALLLTLAAALAATGFNGRRTAYAVPVILPGTAITMLITPISLGLSWPAGTMAALGVFAVTMLGLALTPPPRSLLRNRPVRVARAVVFGIGLAGGGAGLAGSLATPELTLFTLGGAVVVGAVAALVGRTQHARILGWLFATVMAHGFVLTTGLYRDVELKWTAFGVLAVGAVLLLAAATLPRLRHPEAAWEAATAEWSGYGTALVALAIAYDSPRHVAALLAAWGAVLGVAALRPTDRPNRARILFWSAVACEIAAWWLMMYLADVTLPEAYTLPFAVLALLVGLLELRQRPDANSWVAYGPALVAALLPTLVIVIAANTSTLRQVLLLLGAVATLIFGSMRQQQAPVVIGGVVTAATALHALTLVGPWLLLIPVGLMLLLLGASRERRRRAQEGLRALREMR